MSAKKPMQKRKPQYYRKPAQKKLVEVEYIEVPTKPKRVQKVQTVEKEIIRPGSSFNHPPQSFGAKVGGWLGHGIQSVVKAITGFGDYTVLENSLVHGAAGGIDPPNVVNARGGTIIRHREYIGDVLAATAFTVQSYKIQPGLAASFPWCSQVADAYQEWKPRGIVYEYKSMSSDAVIATNTSGSLGTVVMATQYDSTLPNFADKHTMENSEFANSAKPSCSFFHPVECKQSQSVLDHLYLRGDGIPITGKDPRFYDLGNFQIAVSGMASGAAGSVIGELWVTFEFEFYKPELGLAGAVDLTDHFSVTNTTLLTSAAPFGNTDTLIPSPKNSIGCIIRTSNTIQWPSKITDGLFLITYFMNGAVASVSSPAVTTGSGNNVNTAGVANLFIGDTTSTVYSPSAGSTTSSFMFQQIVEITQTSPGVLPALQLVLSNALPTTVQNCDLFITLINPYIT